jgi:O-antigen ligase
MVIDVASRNPLLGVGYGGYWGLQDGEIFSTLLVREAHSGYLDVYLEVGIVGIVLLLAFLLSYHYRALRELNHAFDWGLFGICLLMMTLIHNFTESNFLRTSSYFWNVTVFVTIILSEPCMCTSRD